ncbi:type II toxin-antitoxin system RelE/ParE family toxin [Massilia solisilvae]|uniref:Type II toxin-antitoxin system RelE/ParE family toxin n=1 Tax=Massilia solisilvae TaxID=1811225 RepID=A0ABT2BLP9_9BURK|nr:type II toxin-antitoxin system RelE/ParE family toxin [Massilia solisilvae]MCS0609419.1 type II toxin-antitoxin system RelE/ParE family toxin [Massilia solisilvae]
MAEISYSSQALADLEHISDFLAGQGVSAQLEALDLIDDAVGVLARHPLIGRPAESGLRELVISQGKTGYVALYSYEANDDAILILAIRHQREAGFFHTDAGPRNP